MSKSHEKAMTGTVMATSSVRVDDLKVDRGLNDIRLAVLGILVSIALTIAFGVSDAWWMRGLAFVLSLAVTSLLIRWRRSRHALMSLMHWLTGA